MSENTTLYDILEAEKILEESIGDTEEYLQALEVQKEVKVNSTVQYIRQCEEWAESAKNEAKRLLENARFYEARAERIKKWVAYSMESNDIQKIETSLARLSFRKSETVEIEDESKIPEEYKKEKVIVSIDKTSIKEAFKNGEVVPGVKIEQHNNLQIK